MILSKRKLLPGRPAAVFACLLLLAAAAPGHAADRMTVIVPAGQSEVLDFPSPVKRVAITNPETADATVVSPTQILLDGKAAGVTSLIVWREGGAYEKYRVTVHGESDPRQVMLRVRFLEVNKTVLKELGTDFLVKQMRLGNERLNWGSFAGGVTAPTDPLQLSNTVDFFLSLPTQNLTAMIKALQENNLVSVLAAPNLSALSGEEANFLAGGEFPIPIISGSMGSQTLTILFKEFGVKMRFTPTVLDSQRVRVKVLTEVSSLDFDNGILLSGFRVPALITRKAETTVELAEGQYLVLGGLLSNEHSQVLSKIPVLGSVPVLGKLFSSQRYQKKESELLVTLSPQVIRAVPGEELPQLKLRGPDEEKK
jgi:pilus assembly protein CpaC